MSIVFDPFGKNLAEYEARSTVYREANEKARAWADEKVKERTAELRAELEVQKAIVAELARRLALRSLPPEA